MQNDENSGEGILRSRTGAVKTYRVIETAWMFAAHSKRFARAS